MEKRILDLKCPVVSGDAVTQICNQHPPEGKGKTSLYTVYVPAFKDISMDFFITACLSIT